MAFNFDHWFLDNQSKEYSFGVQEKRIHKDDGPVYAKLYKQFDGNGFHLFVQSSVNHDIVFIGNVNLKTKNIFLFNNFFPSWYHRTYYRFFDESKRDSYYKLERDLEDLRSDVFQVIRINDRNGDYDFVKENRDKFIQYIETHQDEIMKQDKEIIGDRIRPKDTIFKLAIRYFYSHPFYDLDDKSLEECWSFDTFLPDIEYELHNEDLESICNKFGNTKDPFTFGISFDKDYFEILIPSFMPIFASYIRSVAALKEKIKQLYANTEEENSWAVRKNLYCAIANYKDFNSTDSIVSVYLNNQISDCMIHLRIKNLFSDLEEGMDNQISLYSLRGQEVYKACAFVEEAKKKGIVNECPLDWIQKITYKRKTVYLKGANYVTKCR